MKLKEILNGIENLKAKGDLETEITTVTRDSKEAKEGSLFVAIKGFQVDRTHIYKRGCTKWCKSNLSRRNHIFKKVRYKR
jgi:UDP-N-acetylmuramoyl-L-alanyl-D-glutamate--2,6-diaminopimelate ligase